MNVLSSFRGVFIFLHSLEQTKKEIRMSHSLFDHHKKTDEEKQKVVEGLKAVDGAEEFDDFTLDRFAKARNYDLGKAKTMLTKHISWRNRTFPIAEKEIEEELEMKKVC